MSRLVVLPAVLLLAAGCQPARTTVDDQVVSMNQMTDVLNKVNNDGDAAALMPQLEDAAAQVKAANKRAANNSKNASPEQKQAVRDQYGEVVKSAGLKLSAAGMAAQLRARKHASKIQLLFDDINGLVPPPAERTPTP